MRLMYLIGFLLSQTIAASFVLAKSPPPIPAGSYEYSGSRGTMEITSTTATGFHFGLTTVASASLHFCDIEGVATRSSGTWAFQSDKCRITFAYDATQKEIEIEANVEECRDYCGYNGGFTGWYRPAIPACSSEWAKNKKAYLSLYKQKKYDEAYDSALALLNQCDFYMTNPDTVWMRNDIALFALRKGDPQECLNQLKKGRDLMGASGALAEAQWTNAKLCQKALDRKATPTTHRPGKID